MRPRNDVMVAMGTRPEAIKLAGIVAELGPDARVVHTGQHYDPEMWGNVVRQFPALQIHHSIAVGGRSRGEQIGTATEQITRYLIEQPVKAMVVQGDTNSTLAGALAAMSLGIPVVHVEAGLRSHDRSMPEETNRVLVDSIADLCCAPLEINAETLLREGVSRDRIDVTGNTLLDALNLMLPAADAYMAVLRKIGLDPFAPFVLSTVHRAALVDDRESLRRVLAALAELSRSVPVILPMHPHTAQRIADFELEDLVATLTVIKPLAPSEFLALESAASLLLSDSGGVQEEACLLRRPLLVLRDSTERPELLDGWCRLLGDQDVQTAVLGAWQDSREWEQQLARLDPPYSSGSASAKIVQAIRSRWGTDEPT